MKLAAHIRRARARRLAEQLRRDEVERTAEVVSREIDELEATPDDAWTEDLEARRGALFREYSERLRAEQLDVAGDEGEERPA